MYINCCTNQTAINHIKEQSWKNEKLDYMSRVIKYESFDVSHCHYIMKVEKYKGS